jgi:hypothetical protein
VSWEQLRAILEENRLDREREEREPPVACPIDGTLLDVRDDGVRNCPMGNYTWRG